MINSSYVVSGNTCSRDLFIVNCFFHTRPTTMSGSADTILLLQHMRATTTARGVNDSCGMQRIWVPLYVYNCINDEKKQQTDKRSRIGKIRFIYCLSFRDATYLPLYRGHCAAGAGLRHKYHHRGIHVLPVPCRHCIPRSWYIATDHRFTMRL